MSAWAQTMLLWSWQSLLLIGLVLIVVRVARSQSATARHSFWLLAVLMIAILPAVNAVVRIVPVKTPAVESITYIAQLPAEAIDATPTVEQSPAAPSDLWMPLLFAVWASGVLISAVRSFRTHRRWHRVARSVLRVDKAGSPVPVGYSAEVEAPVLIGTLSPMIVLPASIETWTTAEERRAVLLHEAAHVQRRDHWVSPVQAFIGAVFFFHPAVRYALRQLVFERELACDEHVLSVGASPSTYAEVILKVAERSISGRQSDCPAFASPAKILERRVKMILSHSSAVSVRWQVPVIARAAIVLALASLLLPQSATLAEIPAPPRLEIRAAAFQPLMESVSVIAAAPQVPVSEGNFATVSGIVLDPTGALVPGVTVTLLPANSQETRTAMTNDTGSYTFNRIAPGEWTIQARMPAFTSVDQKIQLRAGETVTQNVRLAVAGMATQVIVRASRSALAPNPNPANIPLPQRIGGDIKPAHLISQVKPQYPASARALGVQDYVQLQATIGRDGTIVSLQLDPNRVGMGNTDLNKAAMDAVQQWRYSPAMLNGMPIEMATTITVNFTLE
jgi:TonB family protein